MARRIPHGRGAGEQWVREIFPRELAALRSQHVYRALIAMIDADRKSVNERMTEFDKACTRQFVQPRKDGEPVALFVAKRNIETWIAYLDGEHVNENDVYPKLDHERECQRHVVVLKEMCDANGLRDPALPSLEIACHEYRTQIQKNGDLPRI